MNYRITIVEQKKPNVQLPGPGRPSVSLLRLTGRNFPEHIPPTEKKSTPTKQCFIRCRKTKEKGMRIRRGHEFIAKSAIWACVPYRVLGYTIL
ncbi:hypothetical protein TNCT_394071 [Trichonephila clavata]|uniref:Uncharacterized protein n=1 Tax=Trichonephila clavata TaxID=2740835 RepID=A0A8X6LFE6_TRICU|nr:hypothetical protein TNCT_394071 [Trichonephila clavata]